MSGLKDKIMRQISGDGRGNDFGKTVANDAILANKPAGSDVPAVAPDSQAENSNATAQNGESSIQNDEINVNLGSDQSDDDSECASKCYGCKKTWESMNKSKNSPLECCFCKKWYCQVCSDVKKGELSIMTRSDVFWACRSCKPHAQTTICQISDLKNIKQEVIKCVQDSMKTSVDEILPSSIDKIIEPIKSAVVGTVEKTINSSMSKSWASTLFGESEFPEVDSPTSLNAPKKPKLTMTTALKKAVVEQKHDELRQSNIILYKAAEPEKDTAEGNIQADKKTVKDMLDHLQVQEVPVKIFRLGKYDENSENPRPIKLVFKDTETQDKVMSKAYKLASASDDLKGIGISYDMTKEQRVECRTLVSEAKELSKNSTTHKYKVTGRPGNMRIKEILKENPRN